MHFSGFKTSLQYVRKRIHWNVLHLYILNVQKRTTVINAYKLCKYNTL